MDDRFFDRLSRASAASGLSRGRFIEEACADRLRLVELIAAMLEHRRFEGTGCDSVQKILADHELAHALEIYSGLEAQDDFEGYVEFQQHIDGLIAVRRGDTPVEDLGDG